MEKNITAFIGFQKVLFIVYFIVECIKLHSGVVLNAADASKRISGSVLSK